MEKRMGSCLCGQVNFAMTGNIRGVGSCHCSKCRKVSGTNGNAVFLVPVDSFEWLEGEDLTFGFSFPDGWGVKRCNKCGSPVPTSIDGKQFWVQAGLMDDPLDTEMKQHIFCASRADWDRESPNARFFDEFPG
jgi:hypothetical protein